LVVALAMEPRGSMMGSRIKKKNKIIDRFMIERMFVQGITMMFGTVWLFSLYLPVEFATASTVALTALAVFQWFNMWNCRYGSDLKEGPPKANWYLYAGTLIVVILQLFAVYSPFFQRILKTVPLEIFDWLLIILVSSTVFVTDWTWRKMREKAFNFI
jgi:Ca2+-transporting ATPase